jgi:hypothetical protein
VSEEIDCSAVPSPTPRVRCLFSADCGIFSGGQWYPGALTTGDRGDGPPPKVLIGVYLHLITSPHPQKKKKSFTRMESKKHSL